MFKKMKTSVVWWLGGSAVLGTVVYLLSGNLIYALLSFALSFVLFPPFTDLVLQSKYPRLVKAIIVLVIVAGAFYYQSGKEKEKQLDNVEISRLETALHVAADYCKSNKKCADNINQLEGIDQDKYEYESIDNGKDCVLRTKLPSGKNFSDICINRNSVEYLKYLR